MKTAEVAIEHVLTGVLALCAFLLPLLSGLNLPLGGLQQSEALVGVLGLAYLFGVVFDKLADTVLSPIEQRLRLRLASGFLEKGGARYAPDWTRQHLGDPFPQDVLEFSLRGEKNGRTDWIDSLRSRIRTSRGLAVLGLPAMMGLAIYLTANQFPPPGSWQLQPKDAVILNLLLLFTSVLLVSEIKVLKPIRTDKLADDQAGRDKQIRRATKLMFVSCSFYALMMINSLLTLTVIGARRSGLTPVVIVVVGVVMVSPLWVWYHITGTHMSFIYRKLPELMEAEKKAAAETDKS